MEINVFLSQPMTGFTEEEIIECRENTKNKLDRIFESLNMIKVHSETIKYSIIDNTQFGENKTPLGYLAKDVELLDKTDIVVFTAGWQKSRGCNIEYQLAKTYNIPMIFIDDNIIPLGITEAVNNAQFRKKTDSRENNNIKNIKESNKNE